MYGDGVKGSPVLAAELASQKYPGLLRCINVEYDPDNFSDLEKHTLSLGNIVSNYQGKFSDRADSILQQVASSPCLFFLDDFGVKGSDWVTVKKVLGRRCKTDIWIRFDHKTIRRLDGHFESNSKGSAQKIARLSEHFGITDSNMLHSLLDGATSEDRIQNAIKVYQNQLESELGLSI